MVEHKHEAAKSHNFSLAFEQMASFVAIAGTKSADETLRQLVLQSLVVLSDERFEDVSGIAEAIDVLFGLQIPRHEVENALDILERDGLIHRPAGTNYTLPLETRARLQQRINVAALLEERVKQEWLEEISKTHPKLAPDELWKVLKRYLALAFRRHGVQTTALLDPSVEIDAEHAESLSVLLKEALKGTPFEQQPIARSAIASFFGDVGQYPDRATYITQLADGTFNYFSLTVAPDVAEQFQRRLNPLALFLDTNFLFGILGLTVNPQVAVSNDLLQAIGKHKLPFDLHYHQRTEQEIRSSLANYRGILLSRMWPRSLSRAVALSRYVSGVELAYHQQHAETGIDVESFFRPYDHVDIILQQRHISEFRPTQDRLHQRAYLLNDYKDWLEERGRKKPYNIVDHDSTVLDQVRQLRSDAKSSLEAGALLITCDYNLFRFDWETSRKTEHLACTVLPNLFWQILRPFVPSDRDFDRAFAETFAIPEFRTISSGASVAASKLIFILAGYRGFPEETAARILSNDLLIERLRIAENDQRFQEYVEAAIVAENTALLEERNAIAEQLEREQAEKEEKERLLEETRAELGRSKREVEETSQEATHAIESERLRASQAEAQAKDEQRLREEAQRLAAETREKLQTTISVLKGTVLGAIAIALFEFIVNAVPQLNFLVQHPRSLSLQLSIDGIIALTILGAFLPKARKWLWTVGIFGIGLVILQVV